MRRLLIITYLLLPCVLQAQVIPTNEWVSFWSDQTVVDFRPVRTGSVVRAYDPQGVLCGEFIVTTPGAYGLMPVYRDDLTTPDTDEGAEPGDLLSFTIDDLPALSFGSDVPVWTSNGDIKRVNLAAGKVDMDIKPGSCPNPFNRKLFEFAAGSNPRKGGVLPVAVLGSETFDVAEIDVSTLRLEGVPPLMLGGGPKPEDVATALDDGSDCECTDDGPDGFIDLKMKFRRQEIAAAVPIGLPGEERVLTLTGELLDGTPFEATDCVVFVGPRDDSRMPTDDGPTLNTAFPNPFNPVTRISYSIPERQHVRLVIYDVAGRLVDELTDQVMGPGDHVVEWDAGRFPSGIYFYRLNAGTTTLTRKMVFLK